MREHGGVPRCAGVGGTERATQGLTQHGPSERQSGKKKALAFTREPDAILVTSGDVTPLR